MIEITEAPISPERVVAAASTHGSGCVVTYVGLIRDYSEGRAVLSVEYRDPDGSAADVLRQIATEAKEKWSVEDIAIVHRAARLSVGDINLVIAVASAHRGEGFAACQYAIDQFKQRLPTQKKEAYRGD